MAIATLIVFMQVRNHGFVNYDDPGFITENSLIQSGLTVESVKSAFQKNWGYWKPVACLSLMLDYEIYGMDPGGFHLTNLILHTANTLLLFLFLRMITGAQWKSAFVAALFALHPLHVESVAWVTERKDVLSTFFWMLAMFAYIYYLKKPGFKRYTLIIIPMALGLMTKPMLVTLPFVLLLLDYWPLGRLEFSGKTTKGKTKTDQPTDKTKKKKRKNNKGNSRTDDSFCPPAYAFKTGLLRLIREKVPIIILVAITIFVIISFQNGDKDSVAAASPALDYKVSNALISYVKYIGKMLLPINLAAPYPHTNIPWSNAIFAFIILLCFTFAAVKTVRTFPYIAVGWFWYLGTLVPVLGLVHFGSFSMADRFTYIPLTGLFIIISWGIPDLMSKWAYRRIFLRISSIVILLVLTAMTWKQAGYWKNSITLFEHTLETTSNNYLPHNNLALALKEQGRLDDAVAHYKEAIRIKPDYEKAHNNLGVALEEQDRLDEAVKHYVEALNIKPDYEEAYNNLGIALQKKGYVDEAVKQFNKALSIRPDYWEAHNNLGNALKTQGHIDEAVSHFKEALRIRPDYVKAHVNLAIVLQEQGRIDEAVDHYSEVLRIEPDNLKVHNNLGIALAQKGNIDRAAEHFRKALQLNPDYVNAQNNLERILMLQKMGK